MLPPSLSCGCRDVACYISTQPSRTRGKTEVLTTLWNIQLNVPAAKNNKRRLSTPSCCHIKPGYQAGTAFPAGTAGVQSSLNVSTRCFEIWNASRLSIW